jgi:hypothetical protein
MLGIENFKGIASQNEGFMRLIAILSIAILGSSAVLAGPVYLDCKMPRQNEAAFRFQVKLDEATGKITHSQENGFAFNTEGFFSANKISYQKIDSIGPMKLTLRYEINRSTLDVTRQLDSSAPEKGTCEVISTTDRKI